MRYLIIAKVGGDKYQTAMGLSIYGLNEIWLFFRHWYAARVGPLRQLCSDTCGTLFIFYLASKF